MSIVQDQNLPKSRCRKFFDWVGYEETGKWLKDMKGSVILTATIIATMTFALATNPPGGVVQASTSEDETDCMTRNERKICVGEAILANRSHDNYSSFLTCNTISFIASLIVILVLVSGIPIKRGFGIWVLSICMCITLTFLALTYMFAANMVTPNSIWSSVAGNVFGIANIVYAAVASIVILFQVLRIFVNKCYK